MKGSVDFIRVYVIGVNTESFHGEIFDLFAVDIARTSSINATVKSG